jgi:hypothetical protein
MYSRLHESHEEGMFFMAFYLFIRLHTEFAGEKLAALRKGWFNVQKDSEISNL